MTSKKSMEGLEEPKKKAFTFFDDRTTNVLMIILSILILIIIVRFIMAHFSKRPQTVTAIPVNVGLAKTKDVPVYLTELGNVIPVYTITVKTQIDGQLSDVYFKEGQIVKKGDVLAQIDPRPYLAQLLQYQGQLMKDKAALANDTLNMKRYQKLWKQDAVSRQTLDNQITLVKQDEGAIKTDLGLIEGVKVNLIYCRIISPVDGRIGLRLVDPGNFVQTTDTTGLAVIATLQPITVIFTIPEDNIPDVLAKVTSGNQLDVKAYDRQQNTLLSSGKAFTIDNQVDTTTGMVKLRAIFNNAANKLFPNQFVNIKLLVKMLPQATVVPTAAIQFGPQNNSFVYIVNSDNTVSIKYVKTGVIYGDDTVVLSGIKAGTQVIIQGIDKIKNGSKIRIANAKAHQTQVNGQLTA